MSFSIIFYSNSDKEFLFHCFSQARHSNPDARIIVLGTQSISHYAPLIESVDQSSYWEDALRLEREYTHLSPLSHGFELVCIQRWFAINDMQKKLRLQNIFVADTDVMIYSNLQIVQQNFAHSDFTLSGFACAHDIFFNNPEVLEDFKEFVFSFYAGRETFEYRREEFLKDPHYKVSDMTLWQDFVKARKYNVVDNSLIANSSTFDPNFRQSHGFEMDGIHKRLFWIKNKPYGKHEAHEELIKFNTLHFQGSDFKQLMARMWNLRAVS